MEEINITDSFEVPSKTDWLYLESKNINDIRIDINKFNSYQGRFLLYPRINELIKGFNNKIYLLSITYTLCHHYYDLGIPDEPWYISPSEDGKKSVQYMPNFRSEHYMRHFWFSYFASNLYINMFGIYDCLINLIANFYGISSQNASSQRKDVVKYLKENFPQMLKLLDDFKENKIYKQANKYRNRFVHGTAPNEISQKYKDRNFIVNATFNDKKSILKEENIYNSAITSCSIGEYTPVKNIIETFDKLTEQTVILKNQIIEIMIDLK